MTDRISIDSENCSSCGLCVSVCPNQIMEAVEGAGISLRSDRMPLCIGCGQCMAVCPSKAIVVEGMDYERDFFVLPKTQGGEAAFFELIRTRRAIRAFRDRPVPRDLLEKVVEAMAFAPPGFTPIKTEVVVVQDTSVIREALPEMVRVYDDLVRAMAHPIARWFVRHKVGREKFTTLMHHVVPMMRSRLPDLKEGNEDTITRNAPAMLLLHAHRDAENYQEDIPIALTYGFLAAHALGLGGSAMSLIPPAIQNSPALRRLFMIPEDHVVVGSMIIGYPKYRYQRGIKRKLRDVKWI